MISFLVGRKNGPRVEIPKPPQRKSQKNLGAKSRKALKSKDFRKYLNWSYTPSGVDTLDVHPIFVSIHAGLRAF